MPVAPDTTFDPVNPLSSASLGLDVRSQVSGITSAAKRFLGTTDVAIWLANKCSGFYDLVSSESQEQNRQAPAIGHKLSLEVVSSLKRNIPATVDFPLPWKCDGLLRLACQLYSSDRMLGVIDFHFDSEAIPHLETKKRNSARFVARLCTRLDQARRARMMRELNVSLTRIAEAETLPELKTHLLEGAFRILDTDIGAVMVLDKETGGLNTAIDHPYVKVYPKLLIEEGLTGDCLRKLEAKRIGDIARHPHFKEYWPGMRSELVVPLFVPKSSARVANNGGPGSHLANEPKRIGVMNFESPLIDAFSETEEEYLVQLAKSGSVIFDLLQTQQSLNELYSAESDLAKRLVAGNEWLDDIRALVDHIRNALAFSHINISVVSLDGKRIRSEYISWNRSQADSEKFMRMSDHDLATSKDIQADVVRTRQIEVPESNDRRFHPEVHQQFELDKLIRVYIPLIMGDVVVGTLEAGYRRKFRQFIFERDIQMLKALSDHATAAIWKKRRGGLDILRHEISAPRHAIMDNAMFLKREWRHLSEEKIGWKLDDILLDGEAIDSLLDRMEYFVSGRLRDTTLELCNVGQAVISKTIFQQGRKLRGIGLDLSRISFKTDVRIMARVDKVKLAAVFSNLFENALKYRVSNESFKIEVTAEGKQDRYIVQVADWGIGIEAGCEKKIFDEGFRTPAAIERAVGSGLGLWLAKEYMSEMRGELNLMNRNNPTAFQIVIPKGGTR